MSSRLKVLHVIPWLLSGGVERRRLQLVQGLDPLRYEQRMLCLYIWDEFREAFDAAGVEVIELKRPGGIRDPGSLLQAWQVVRDWQPDIVHGAVFEGLTMAVAGGRMGHAPVVIIEETSHAVNRSWKGHRLFQALALASTKTVAVSHEVGDYLNEVTHVPRSLIHVIPNGVSLPREVSAEEAASVRDEFGFTAEHFVIGSVGRMVDETHKRWKDLILAVATVHADHPEVRLLIAGDGDERLEVQQWVEDNGHSDYVVLAGYRSDVAPIYHAMDLFALASEREAFGLVLVEAMFCEKPVVATAVGGMKRIVVDGTTGKLVPVRRPDLMAEALIQLMGDADLRASMGVAGRERAESEYSSDRYVRDVASLYETLASRHPRT